MKKTTKINKMFNSSTFDNRFGNDNSKEINEKVTLDNQTIIDDIVKLTGDVTKEIKKSTLADILVNHGINANGMQNVLRILKKDDILLPAKRGYFKVTDNAIAKYTNSKPKGKSDLEAYDGPKGKSQDLDKALSKKVVKYKVPKSVRGEAFEEFFISVLTNMKLTLKKISPEKLMLKGDPGTGKTSSVSQLATLFGMHLVTIEGAHISEENIINIPYVVTKGHSSVSKVAQYIQTDVGFEVLDAKSALVSEMENLGFIKDTDHQKMLNQNKLMKKLYLENKVVIDSLRLTPTHKIGFSIILFIDEYYRTGSVKISNLLRTILNGDIGNTKIPKSAYLIFASNFDDSDGSLDDIALNQQFTNINFDIPSPDDFMSYIGDKFTPYDIETEEEDNVPRGSSTISKETYNKFQELIDEDDMGSKSNNVRVSPRRMEQIMLYVDSKIPCDNGEDAKALMSYLEIQFRDPETGKYSELYSKYKNGVQALIEETNPDLKGEEYRPFKNTEWKKVLSSAIDAKMDIGKDRTYPIVLSGMPGTSKTFTLVEIAKDKNMGLIKIDASTLTNDDVLGLPTPYDKVVLDLDGQPILDSNGNQVTTLETKFTEPPLYKRIMNQYVDQENLKQDGRQYNYIMLIDELTRVKSISIFNKIRMLLLEKKVNQNFPIPNDIIIVSAMNPTDSAGDSVMELPDHTKDVVDILPVALSIQDVETYIQNITEYDEEEKALGFPVKRISFELLKSIYYQFQSSEDEEGLSIQTDLMPFYWHAKNTIMYVSAREFADIYQGVIMSIHTRFIDIRHWNEISDLTEDIYDVFITEAKKATWNKYDGIVDFIGSKNKVESIDLNDFKKIISQKIKISELFNLIKDKKSEVAQTQTLSSLLSAVNYDFDVLMDEEGDVLVENYLNSLDDYSMVSSDIGIIQKDMITVTNGSPAGYIKLLTKLMNFIDGLNWGKIQNGVQDTINNVLGNFVQKWNAENIDAFTEDIYNGNLEIEDMDILRDMVKRAKNIK